MGWVAEFAREEGPTLIEGGGKRGVETVQGIAQRLALLVKRATECKVEHVGFNRQRVQDALRELAIQLQEVDALAAKLTKADAPRPRADSL